MFVIVYRAKMYYYVHITHRATTHIPHYQQRAEYFVAHAAIERQIFHVWATGDG